MKTQFKQNKYTKWYYMIIENAMNRPLPETFERHHIVPKSLGGSNSKSNIANLTLREHFLCHWLLLKMVNGGKNISKMRHALWMMCYGSNRHKRSFASRYYEIARNHFINVREGKTWIELYGKEKADEMRRKASARLKNKPKSASTRAKISKANKERGPNLYKQWKVTCPDGMIVHTSNLAQFCREHNLSKGNFSTYGHTKGYQAEEISKV